MCAGGDQTVTQRTELDPSLQRLLYGGALTSEHGLTSVRPPPGGMAPAAPAPAENTGPYWGNYAQGGPISSAGVPSLMPNMPLAQNGVLPNLSNRETAAALAMAMHRPQMMERGYARGGYVEGPGTGTSDSIPAMIYQDGRPVQRAALSDGEFVMTERAVRGAGDGDRARGAARMYEMMRSFERGGRV